MIFLSFARSYSTSLLPAASLLGALMLSGCGGDTNTAVPASSIRTVACTGALREAGAECGILLVPENRRNGKTRMIELPFVNLRADVTSDKEVPVLLLGGGPGPSIVSAIAGLPPAQLKSLPLRRQRDVLVLEQRGAALSTPSALDCPELMGKSPTVPGFDTITAASAAAVACKTRLTASGLQLEAYNTTETAADIEDLQQLLTRSSQSQSWHIAATSYGTRVAQTLLARKRLKITTVVLDGPLPLDGSAMYSAGLLDAIDALTDACTNLPGCAQAFPQLRRKVESGFQALLAGERVVAGGTHVNVDNVARQLRAALANADLGLALAALDALGRQDWNALALALRLDQVPPVMPTPSGLFHTVMCADEPDAALVQTGLPAEGAQWPNALRTVIASVSAAPTPALCKVWGGGNASLPTPAVRADVPVLVIAGQFDPLTPPTNYGRYVKVQYPNSRLLVAPLQGHGLLETLTCVQEAAARFQQRPSDPVALQCDSPGI